MAPEVHGELHAGHVVGSDGVDAAAGAAGLACTPADRDLAAAAACGLAAPLAAGAANMFLHFGLGQRTVFPAAAGGICIGVLHFGHLMTCAMILFSSCVFVAHGNTGHCYPPECDLPTARASAR